MPSQSESEMTAFFAQRRFGQQIGFGERPGLVVIDILNTFTDLSQPLGADLSREIEAIRQVLNTRRIDMLLIHGLHDERLRARDRR